MERNMAVLDTAAVHRAIQQEQLSYQIQAIFISQATKLVAHWGALTETELAGIALQVGEHWRNRLHKAQVQFTHLPARADDMLLYTRPVNGSIPADVHYLLTFVAMPQAPLSQLRTQADRLVENLMEVVTVSVSAESTSLLTTDDGVQGKSFAIFWLPIKPLPQRMRIPIRRVIKRLAAANNYQLTYIMVQSEFIHLVVMSQSDDQSSHIASLFKEGSEERIQQQYNMTTDLWDVGYYAVESTIPLSQPELDIFLNKTNRLSA